MGRHFLDTYQGSLILKIYQKEQKEFEERNFKSKLFFTFSFKESINFSKWFETGGEKKKSLFPQKRIWYGHYSFSASQQQHLENYLTFLFLSGCIQITNNVQHAVTKPLM